MSQQARPASDLSDGQWTPTPVWRQVNEQNPDTSTFVTSANDPQGDSFVVALSAVAFPDSGPQTLKVIVRRSGPGPVRVTVALLQGGAVIAATAFDAPAGFSETDLVLTAAQAAAITDYSQLQAQVTAGAISVPGCDGPVPALLHATFAGGTGTCACVDGATVPLVWNALNGRWEGALSACGGTTTVVVYSSGGAFFGTGDVNPAGLSFGTFALGGACGAVTNLTGTANFDLGCSGQATVTVTN